MNLETQINDGIKQAMLSKEKVRLAALRAIKAEILLAKTADGSDEISDAAVLKIIQKLVKQRKESAPVYAENNRPALAENELAWKFSFPSRSKARSWRLFCRKSSPRQGRSLRPTWAK